MDRFADIEHDYADDKCISNQNIRRITQNVVQNGYADGVADGRAKLYQEDFDRGYEKGFSMGFELARYQGFAIGAQKQADKIPQAKLMQSDLILKQHAARAHCQLCVNKALERNGMGEILEIQTRHNEGVTSKLMERFGNVE